MLIGGLVGAALASGTTVHWSTIVDKVVIPMVVSPLVGFVGALVLMLALPAARSETTRTQTINLQKGWNSVYLQVSPTNREPNAVFANTPIEIAATYFALDKSVQYIQNPGSTGWIRSRHRRAMRSS